MSNVEGLYLANKSFWGEPLEKEKMKELQELCILILKRCDESTIEFLNNLELKKLQWVFILECFLEKLPSFSSSQVMIVYSAKDCGEAMDIEGCKLEVCEK